MNMKIRKYLGGGKKAYPSVLKVLNFSLVKGTVREFLLKTRIHKSKKQRDWWAAENETKKRNFRVKAFRQRVKV